MISETRLKEIREEAISMKEAYQHSVRTLDIHCLALDTLVLLDEIERINRAGTVVEKVTVEMADGTKKVVWPEKAAGIALNEKEKGDGWQK